MFNLESLMYDLNITQNELATVLGVSQTAISKVKNYKMDIPEAWKKLIMQKYNIDITNYYIKNTPVASEPEELYIAKKQDDNEYLHIIKSLASSNEKLAKSVEKMADSIYDLTSKK